MATVTEMQWALWFTSNEQVIFRLSTRQRPPDEMWAKAERIIAEASCDYEASIDVGEFTVRNDHTIPVGTYTSRRAAFARANEYFTQTRSMYEVIDRSTGLIIHQSSGKYPEK